MANAWLASLLFLVWFCNRPKPNSSDFSKLVGGPCEGCEAIFEFGNKKLLPTDTLPDYRTENRKLLLRGTVFEPNGKTPAEGVVVYVYHTNSAGIYPPHPRQAGWAQRHGQLRGWAKTDSQGRYAFYTAIPGSYPDRVSPAHVHVTLLEPNGRYYWVQEFHFEGDSLLTQKEASPPSPRGGSSGLLQLKNEGGLLVGERDFILGRNIPGY